MNLIDYGRILARRGWIMLLVAIIAAGSAYYLSTRMQTIYRSTQKVLMQPSRADLGLTEASKTLLGNHVAYLDSEFIAQQVIDNLRLDMTPGFLKSKVTIAPDPLSLSIQIDVDLPDGDLANDVAREWGNMLIQYRVEENQIARREDQIKARLQDVARYDLLQPRPTINAAAGAVLGLLLGGIIVFVLEYLESSIVRNREDIERSLDLPVLATIPDLQEIKNAQRQPDNAGRTALGSRRSLPNPAHKPDVQQR
jgi:capsular polysaccharide biosynthesis protein